jgi:hypothetical protein
MIRARSTYAHLLLILAAVQGITPDGNDLASSRGLELVILEGAPSNPWSPAERLLGEVSGPVAPDPGAATRRVADVDRVAVSGQGFGGWSPTFPPVAGSGRRPRRAEPLIRLLCRLNC